MPKPMLRQNIDAKQNQLLDTAPVPKRNTVAISKERLDTILRKKRSKEYMEAVSRLDGGGHFREQQITQELMDALDAEFPEVDLRGILVGLIAVCRLGAPYEVHTLDIAGQIIHHYEAGEILPDNMERLRSLAMRGGYAFIEVYTDCARAVSKSGTVSVITL